MCVSDDKVSEILKGYSSENIGVKTNLARVLMHGQLGGTGKLLILPVDHGFEHGPAMSFSTNTSAYDPNYHFSLAVDAKVNAFAAHLGMLECAGDQYAGKIPLILKMNAGNKLYSGPQDQAIIASVKDALRLGCVGIGFSIYHGAENYYCMLEEARELIQEAKSFGLFTTIWSYPRSHSLPEESYTALDVVAYGAHVSCLLGAHIIKVKVPSSYVYRDTGCYENVASIEDRVSYMKQACFNGKRILLFSGGQNKTDEEMLAEVKALSIGGANGSIIGRNLFQRTKIDALDMVSHIAQIYSQSSILKSTW